MFKSKAENKYVSLLTAIRNQLVPIKLSGATKFVELAKKEDLNVYDEFNKYEKRYLNINQFTVPRYLLNPPPTIRDLPADSTEKRTQTNKYLRFFFDLDGRPTETIKPPTNEVYDTIINNTLFFFVPRYSRASTRANLEEQESPWTSKPITGDTQIATAYGITSQSPLRPEPIASTPNVNRTLLEIVLHIAIDKYVRDNGICAPVAAAGGAGAGAGGGGGGGL